jgi:hypothetical protein
MGLIFHLHTESLGGSMVYTDHVPRIGEKLRVDTDIVPEQNGIYEIEDVVYGIPFDQVQRIDVYAKRVAHLPSDLSYSSYFQALHPTITYVTQTTD